MVDIAFIGPHLASFARCVEENVSLPVRSRISASLREEDTLPLVRDVPIVVTSHWTARLGEAARAKLTTKNGTTTMMAVADCCLNRVRDQITIEGDERSSLLSFRSLRRANPGALMPVYGRCSRVVATMRR